MSPKIFTTLALATAAAAGITALAVHSANKTECACEDTTVVAPIDREVHYIKPDYGHHFARPPAPQPVPTPSPAPVA